MTLVSSFCDRVVNEPLESISLDLGFKGNTLAEGDTFFINVYGLSMFITFSF